MAFLSTVKSLLGIQPKKPPLISAVLHFRHPIPLSDEDLRSAIARAWGRDVSKELNEYVNSSGAIRFIKFDGMVHLLTNTKKPYCPAEYLEQALSEFSELRQKKIVREHKAFLSIDLLSPKDPPKAVKEDCYRRMCRLAAEFADDNCMGVYLPETGHLRPYDSEIKKALRSERPLEEIAKWGEAPVMVIEDDDPRLQQAVAEARRRWPEFLHAFERRSANQDFGVKALFTDGAHGEWMWVAVSSIEGEDIRGKLGNSPVDVRNLHEGDTVTIQASAIGDWFYSNGDQLVGGFSLASADQR